MDLEVLGDWSNLKGSVYHLVYAIHLLLTGDDVEVRFYEGNDLLVRPIAPTQPAGIEDASTAHILARGEDHDAWVQLKLIEDNWTLSRLIRDNLLANFIVNALRSEHDGRSWSAHLVTPAIVSIDTLKPYIADALLCPTDRVKLNSVVSKVREICGARSEIIAGASDEDLVELARKVLREIAATKPIRMETLHAEVEREIAFRYPDPVAVAQIATSLLGAMLKQVGRGPAHAGPFNNAWVTEASGGRVTPRAGFIENPTRACDASIQRSLPTNWTSSACVSRGELLEDLDLFLSGSGANHPLFVLVGAPNSGKSWALTDWAVRILAGRTRVVVRRENLAASSLSLGHLLATQLGEYRPEWSGHLLRERLNAAAMVAGRGPLVVVIDDPIIHAGELVVIQETVRRLVDECRAIGAKLVLACAKPTWEMSGLARLLGSEVFPRHLQPDPERDAEQPTTLAVPTSYELGDFTPTEVLSFLDRRLATTRAAEIARQLQSPDLLELANPYLLQLYFDQHRTALEATGQVPPKVGIDALLDRRIVDAEEDIAAEVGVTADEAETALSILVDALWNLRPDGLRPSAAIATLSDLWDGETARRGLASLQRRGILTRGAEVRLGEPAIAARLFAKRLLEKSANSQQIPIADLHIDIDAPTVVALVRSVSTPLPLAERLLSLDSGWRSSIVKGLSQGDASDARTLALLDVLRRGDGTFLDVEAIEALGRLAARSDVAWSRVEELFLGDGVEEHFVGAQALRTTINLLPELVASTIEKRVAEAKDLNLHSVREGKQRERLLRHTLDPLIGIRTAEAAVVGQRLLNRFAPLAMRGTNVGDWELARMIDEARGMIALAQGPSALSAVISELSTTDTETRLRAGQALRPVVLEQPSQVSEAICDAIRNEHDGSVLNQLLWDAFRLVDIVPGAVMNAIEHSIAVDWRSDVTSGQALSLLSKLVDAFPERVHQLLPARLDQLSANARALHREALAFAWWRVAERLPSTQPALALLADHDIDGVDETYRVFSLRGSAVALLGLMSLNHAQSVELIGRHYLYPGWGLPFLYLWTDDFVAQHASVLSAHPENLRLVGLLIEAVQREDQAPDTYFDRPLHNSSFRCANLCLQDLVPLLAPRTDSVSLLSQLPRKHQALFVAAGLLERGRRDEPLIRFVEDACAEHPLNAITSGSHERDRCRVLLAKIRAGDGQPVDVRLQSGIALRGGEMEAKLVVELAVDHPSGFLGALEEAVETPRDLPLLFRLDEAVKSGAQALIARVYRRMFNLAPIDASEAKRLCNEMLDGISSLPASLRNEEYSTIYTGITNRLSNGATRSIVSLTDVPGAIAASHRRAAHVLAELEPTGEPIDDWLLALASDRQGWWETNEFHLFGDSMQLFRDTIYIFPAVRLALVGFGAQTAHPDPGGAWMTDRTATGKLLHDLGPILGQDSVWNEQRPSALERLRNHTDQGSRDERGWRFRGHLALLLGYLSEAEWTLSRAASLPYADLRTRAAALYDLACTYSRSGNEQACQDALLASDAIKPVDRAWLLEDSDFLPYRERPWFLSFSHGEAFDGPTPTDE